LFIYAPYILPAINNDYSGDEEPSIRRLDDNNNLDINFVDTSDIDIKPKQEGVEEPAKEDLLAARLKAYRKTDIDIIKEFI
jgi:hypothetical protein